MPEGKKAAVQIIKSGGNYIIREVPGPEHEQQPSNDADAVNTDSNNGDGSGPQLPGTATLSGIVLLRNHQLYSAAASLSMSSVGGGEGRFFMPPLFGVTVLGSSHGFDPKGSTSGYVLWVNRRGIMVDPPPHSTAILERNQIHPSAIDGIIVTHVHGDHDAGAFQKILCERRVAVITSPTVYDAFIRKYAALSGIDADFLRRSHRFRPVRIGQELKLRGASFRFFYSLHSIPCLGFDVTFGGKSIVFSGDHMNDPARIQAMFEEGVLSAGRRDQLLAFPWHHDLILHEAGIPPIHTPLATLEALPADVKRRLHVVHVSEGAVREGSGLRTAQPGVRNTLELEVDVPEFSAAVSTLNLIDDIHFLSGLSLAHAKGLLEIAFTRRYNAGQTVEARGECGGDEFCVILTGLLEVSYALSEEDEDDEEDEQAAATTAVSLPTPGEPSPIPPPRLKAVRWTMGDWFGEEVLMASSPSSSSSSSPSAFFPSLLNLQREVRALTDVELLVFPGAELRYILQDTDIAVCLQRRLQGGVALEELLARNYTLRSLTRAQKLHLEGMARVRRVRLGEHVWRAGEPAACCVLVQEGGLAFAGQAGRLMRSVGALPSRRRKSGSLSVSSSGSPAASPFSFSSSSSSAGPAPPTNVLLSQGENAAQTPCPPVFEKGSLVGNPSLLLRAGGKGEGAPPQPFDLVATTDATLVEFPADGLAAFFQQNPGVLLCLLDAEFVL
jgi:CRP-like cAMP-binding protein/glyoxylase-like metal-dependent hydrolase (beta-lactamase superfamily II)